jgi:hypothetical protein
MKVISVEKDYEPIVTSVKKILDQTKTLPENVFRQAFKFFLFITFDELFMPLFFNHIKRYLLEAAENGFWLTVIDPDPSYFWSHFDFFGSIEFSSSDSEDDYLAALNNYPKESIADALAHNSNLLMIFSPTSKWAIYGDRGSGIAICAFSDRAQMEFFKSIYDCDLLGGVKFAAEYAYGATDKNSLREKFCNSYLE